MWPRMSTLWAPEEGAPSGSGDEKKNEPKNTKLKIGSKEYEPKSAEAAMSLYEALQDEDTGKEIIETLARRAGLLDKKDLEPKKDETKKEAESRVAKALKKKLGKDYEKFSDAVGPAFDEILEEILNERFMERDSNNQTKSWSDNVDTFISNHEFTPEIETAMKEYIDDSPPNVGRKGFDAQRYLNRVYKAACEELEVEPKEKGSKKKRGDSTEDLPDFVIRDAPKNATLDDAVEAAIKGIRFKKRD
jgi:hypothetical protein